MPFCFYFSISFFRAICSNRLFYIKMPTFLVKIAIFFIICDKEDERDNECCKLREGNRPPDGISTNKGWEQENCKELEDQSSEKRDDGGHKSIIEGGKESGGKDIKSCKEERWSKKTESSGGKVA